MGDATDATAIGSRARREDYEAIGREGGSGALALVATFMEHSANERERIQESLVASAEKDRDHWRDRALLAEARLDAARQRMLALFYFDDEEVLHARHL